MSNAARMSGWIAAGIAISLLVGGTSGVVRAADSSARQPEGHADFHAWIAAKLPGPPEGLALGPDGAIYASIPQSGEIVRLDERGGFTRVAIVPSPELAKVGRVWGMSFDPQGNLFVAFYYGYSAADEADEFHLACRDSRDLYTGVYKVDVKSGAVVPYLTKRDGWPVCWPDDVTVASDGAIYVTDATLSGIWKIAPGGARFGLWSTDPLLQWPPAPLRTLPEGANDLVLSRDGKMLYVATDGYPAVVAISIKPDGSAGTAVALAHDLSPLDGIELDDEGNIYISEILRDTIRVFSPDGTKSAVVATSDTAPLNGPTSLVFRAGMLCVANFGWDVVPEPTYVTCMRGFRKPVASHQGLAK